ncbi:MAG: hypothetical protein M0Z46_09665 [Actinomycetota bacterium]|jgi:hypothetical protein|nr:hypothetical protein [Actinomycetota bacterium]MDA8357568.1 hypothetical protein [Actinomycetota bacterium]
MEAGLLAATAPHWHLTSSEVALAAAVLVAAVSIVSLAVTNTTTNRRDRREARLDLATRQLNDFYAPLVILLDQDGLVHERLSQGKGTNWHILDNVENVLAHPVDGPLARSIISINERIRDILETKSGLIGDRMPSSFARFLSHQTMLEQALSGKPYVKELEAARYFPKQFEDDIRAGYQRVLDRINRELGDQ